jgi:hypothetical protein
LKALRDIVRVDKDQESALLQCIPTEKAKAGTSTFYTIAIDTGVPAASPSSNQNPLFDFLKGRFGNTSGRGTPSCVSSYISTRMGERSHICSLKTDEKPYQISLSCWRTEDLRGVPEWEKYLHSYASITLHTDEESEVHGLIHRLVEAAVQEVMAKGGQHWEKR